MKIVRFNPSFAGFHIISGFILMFINVFLFRKRVAVTIFPFVFYSNKYTRMHSITKSKQKIYIHQQMECGMVGLLIYFILGLSISSWLLALPVIFLWIIIYAVNYVGNIVRCPPKLYHIFVAFNREANQFGNILHYTILRRPFAWMRYVSLF